ncbi:hemerythrin family protein [Massilia sp. SR12]
MCPTHPSSTTQDCGAALDQLHDRLLDMAVRALALPPEQFTAAFTQLVANIELDFRFEEQLMERFDCADAHLHREQHARMLAGLHHAAATLEQGDPLPAQRALSALREWLPFHIDTQDRHLLRAWQRTANT